MFLGLHATRRTQYVPCRRSTTHHFFSPQRRLMSRCKPVCLSIASAALLLGAAATSATAQTDYYNTDAGRPMQIEDAHAVERRAFEIQAAPFRLERSRGGAYHWGLEP